MHGPPSVATLRRPSWPTAGWGWTVILLAGLLALACPAARAGGHEHEREREREREPWLILPGDRVVRPGEWIELRWTEADEVLELEILLSVDGGRTYTTCISPQLDPDRHGFVWQVPALEGAGLTMRIRYNIGGREIEGAPTGPLTVERGNRRHPQPLGLPPFSGRDPRSPRSSGSQGPTSRTATRPAEAAAAGTSLRPTASRSTATVESRRLATTTGRGAPFTPPRTRPLRV